MSIGCDTLSIAILLESDVLSMYLFLDTPKMGSIDS